MTQAENNWVEIGYILRPHGVRGEMRLVLHAGEDIFPKTIKTVEFSHPDHGEQVFTVKQARNTKGAVLLVCENIQGRDEAQKWKGSAVRVQTAGLVTSEAGFHLFELVGVRLMDGDGEPQGEITGFMDNAGHWVLRLNRNGKEALFPFADELVTDFNRNAGILTVLVPEGLWEATLEPEGS